MKMTNEHYQALKGRVSQVIGQLPQHVNSLRNEPKVKNLADRVIWDVYHSTRMHQLYTYQQWDYSDSHIKTATKKALKELGIDIIDMTGVKPS